MNDPILRSFLEVFFADAGTCASDSDTLVLLAHPCVDGPPTVYDGTFTEVEHLERTTTGTVRVSADPVPFVVTLPADYLRSTDPRLQFRIARVESPLFHPNCAGGVLCLGKHFRPGTRLRPLLEQLHGIVGGRVRGTADPLDAEAARYYLNHAEQIDDLRVRPLWRRPVAARSSVEALMPRPGGEVT